MKKIFLLAASAMMILAGCNKVENVYEGEAQEIAFFSVNKPATKAPVEGTTYTFDDMQVAAFAAELDDKASNTVYFEETNFTKPDNSSYWTGGQYWPVSQAKLNFLAAAPEIENVVTIVVTPADPMIATYTVKDNELETTQYDVMYAAKQAEKGTGSQPDPVDMVFKHAYAWFDFNFKTTTESATIRINSITLNGVACNGTLTVQASNYTQASVTTTAQWTDYTQPAEGISVPGVALELNLTATEFNDGLMIIPEAGITNFVINYTIDPQDARGTTQTLNYTHNLSLSLAKSTKYIFNITINPSEIQIAPEVEDWTDSEPDVDLDLD